MESSSDVLFFVLSGTLGGLANALVWSRDWRELVGFNFWRTVILGALGGFLYYLVYTEWSFPDGVMAFVAGYAFRDVVEAVVERVLGEFEERVREGERVVSPEAKPSDGFIRVIEDIASDVRSCTRCRLSQTRTNAVPGEGSPGAPLMIVGEAPGVREDEEGRPFVGAAGRVLDSILSSLGLDRSKVYVTNAVKCRPPGNRPVHADELGACIGFLEREIRAVKPRVILCLGHLAGRAVYSLSGLRFTGVSQHRGSVVRARFGDVEADVIVTYHPAFTLYNPRLKPELERDIREAVSRALQPIG